MSSTDVTRITTDGGGGGGLLRSCRMRKWLLYLMKLQCPPLDSHSTTDRAFVSIEIGASCHWQFNSIVCVLSYCANILKVSLIYRLRVNALNTGRRKDVAWTSRGKWSTKHIVCNCHQLKNIFRNSGLFPNSTTNMFPTDILYNIIHSILFRWPFYCWRVQLVLLFELYTGVLFMLCLLS